jgi:hypothetical protein
VQNPAYASAAERRREKQRIADLLEKQGIFEGLSPEHQRILTKRGD